MGDVVEQRVVLRQSGTMALFSGPASRKKASCVGFVYMVRDLVESTGWFFVSSSWMGAGLYNCAFP